MVTVHHLNDSRSQRILWALEELGVDYEIVRYARDPKTMLAPESLKKIHPLGKSPVVVDGDAVLAESGAILEHLVERHGGGRLIPAAGTPDRERYRFWLHYAEGSLMPPLLLQLVFSRLKSAPMPFFVKPIARGIVQQVNEKFLAAQLKTHLGFVESELGKSAWLAGSELTAADIQMSFPLEAALDRAGITPETHPRIFERVKTMQARPAYKKALDRGGPYSLAHG